MWEEEKHPRDEQGRFASKAKEFEGMSADELQEHILEAQKYDIDNISKMLNSDLSNAERTFRNAIAAGEVNLKIHKGNQDKHIPGTKNYRQEIENGRSPSILTTNADMLVKKYAGTGKLVFKKGKWIQAEMFAHSGNTGVYINKQKGEQYYTDCGRIHYSNKGTHVVPDRRKK